MSRGELSEKDRTQLLEIVRLTLEEFLKRGCIPTVDVDSPGLLEEKGAFVTIKEDHHLRGCIGTLTAKEPLYRTVMEMAVAAAVEDPRFSPMKPSELDQVTIEISVLSPLKRISSPDQIQVGVHGLYIVKGCNRGVLLPQVAVEQGWDRNTFLIHTCRKAWLDDDDWKEEAEIYTFTAQVISEGAPASSLRP